MSMNDEPRTDAPLDDAPREDAPRYDAPRTDAPRSRYSGGLRAADTDREATATRLRRSYAEGRLDQHEYEARIDRCYAAKHVGELADLTLDLPQDGPRDLAPGQRWPDPRHLAWRSIPIVPIIIALVVLSALTHHHLFWFPWPLLVVFFIWGPFGRRWRARRER